MKGYRNKRFFVTFEPVNAYHERKVTMAKKKKKNTSKKRTTNPKQTAPQSKKRSKYSLLALLAGGFLVLTGAYFLYQGEKQPAPSPQLTELKTDTGNLREKRPTLSPHKFTGKVRRAYEVARAIPQVLDRLYCYCRSRVNFNHKNLLSCYVDTHASTWGICIDEAQLASKMHAQGATVSEIQNEIDRKFG